MLYSVEVKVKGRGPQYPHKSLPKAQAEVRAEKLKKALKGLATVRVVKDVHK